MSGKYQEMDSSIGTARLDAIEKAVLMWEPSIYHLNVLRAHYFHTVDEVISECTSAFPDDLQIRAERILELTMSRLVNQFSQLMLRNHFLHEDDLSCISYQSPSDSPRYSIIGSPDGADSRISLSTSGTESPDSNFSIAASGIMLDPSEVFARDLSDLKAIAHRMIHANRGPLLIHAFVSSCHEIVSNDFSLAGFNEVSKDEALIVPWDVFGVHMKNWIRVTMAAFQVILPRKRWLCNEIFAPSSELKETAFGEATGQCVNSLIRFAEAASCRRDTARIMLPLLSMYETLGDALVGFHHSFGKSSNKLIHEKLEMTIHTLGKAVMRMLPIWLEDLVRENLINAIEGGAGIHCLTRYAMSYISRLINDHKISLNLLLHDEFSKLEVDRHWGITPLGHKVLSMLSYLHSFLEYKSNYLKEAGMRELFLINNIHYVVELVNDSELKSQLGDDWDQNIMWQTDKLISSYLKRTWSEILGHLSDNNSGGKYKVLFAPKSVVRQKLKRFNSAFEAIYNLQSSWKVPNPVLRREIREAVSETVIPVYCSFLERHQLNPSVEKYHLDLAMYTITELKELVFNLFEGN
ncbi:Exocyst subunit exo70 family protein F1 [Rhynchospora pubera]|uniref:Exocyst subunit Exo70 family protein n=1 Tax=Rhynchospora pubera TaxID=906938 RepID=A0AAV8FFS7_9POAL|nr:Exocyst subunit exo70 family protein F1 [Rhynchospora pubera]